MNVTLQVDTAPLRAYLSEAQLLLEDVPKPVLESFGRLFLDVLHEIPVGRLFATTVADDGRLLIGVGSGLEGLMAALRALKSDFTHD
ncbi:MAG: hypothetical protein ABGX84_06695 [Alcanivorax sp.]